MPFGKIAIAAAAQASNSSCSEVPGRAIVLKLTFRGCTGLLGSLTLYFYLLGFCRVDVILHGEG